jgi:hypothetical protein
MLMSARGVFTIVTLVSFAAVLIDYCYRRIKYGPIPRIHYGYGGGGGDAGGAGDAGAGGCGHGDGACGDGGGGCGH